jgi:hypothetical protein
MIKKIGTTCYCQIGFDFGVTSARLVNRMFRFDDVERGSDESTD